MNAKRFKLYIGLFLVVSCFLFLLTMKDIVTAYWEKVEVYLTKSTAKVDPQEIKSDFKYKEKISVLVFGDFGKGTEEQLYVGQSMTKTCFDYNCDFAITTGDNIYEKGVQSVSDPLWQSRFEEPYKGLKILFYATLGNHDHYGNEQAQIDYSNVQHRWKMPSQIYAVNDLPDWVSFTILDTEVWTKNSRQQIQFLESEICALENKGWKFVVGHHPLYSSGKHGNTKILIQELLPALKKCKAHAYLAGHDHNQEHFELAGNMDTVVQGAAAEVRPVKQQKSTKESVSKFVAAKTGFSILEIQSHSYKMNFFDRNGKVLYSYERTK